MKFFTLTFFSLLSLGCYFPGVSSVISSPPAQQNAILLVKTHPVSLGYMRLNYYGKIHPDFQQSLNQLGLPDCLAETTSDDRRYLILYYLKERKAFAFRDSLRYPNRPMEVSPPYPITKKEYSTLSQFKKSAQ